MKDVMVMRFWMLGVVSFLTQFSSLISSMKDHPWLAKVLALEHETSSSPPPSPPSWGLAISYIAKKYNNKN